MLTEGNTTSTLQLKDGNAGEIKNAPPDEGRGAHKVGGWRLKDQGGAVISNGLTDAADGGQSGIEAEV